MVNTDGVVDSLSVLSRRWMMSALCAANEDDGWDSEAHRLTAIGDGELAGDVDFASRRRGRSIQRQPLRFLKTQVVMQR
jgi:hypothetical protein